MAKKEISFNFPRPVDNDFFVGHAGVIASFFGAWKKRDEYPIHPVWLLTGPRGIGKATLAYRLARRIFSDLYNRPESEIAAQISVGGIGDLFVVDLEHNISDNKAAKSISIEAVRAMIEKMQLFSMGESWRVVIIDSMDELSTFAPNALLKVLEEPPAKTLFFVIAHSLDRVLPTIRSRSRVEKMRPLSGLEICEIAAKLLPGRALSPDIIKVSGGSFGRIAAMLSTGADGLFDEVVRVCKNPASNSADCLLLAKKIAANPENMPILMDVVAYFGLAELYPIALRDIERANVLHLDMDTTAYKIINAILQCL
ncbi:MAG: AAA family ATPase [Rickettsiales bacterium]|jgi:DNA polymerase-3 subunit delta'|nr:AAA family ATPase [Rickettsiales bacterium]